MNFTLVELWQSMGLGARLITLTLLAMSVASIAVVAERVYVLARSSKQSVAFARKLAELLADGDIDRAANSPHEERAGHLGRVLQAALRTYQVSPRNDEDLTFESVARALERQSQREIHGMKRGVGVLANVASNAPFVGLLGTVLGIVNAFESMSKSGTGGLATVSGGIAEALATTALGLLVAIPAVGAYNGLSAWIDGRAVDIAEASNELLDLLARHLRKNRIEFPRDTGLTGMTLRSRQSMPAER
ncbi:MAG: MotA/TolQ/ExbB proton channel family protein [Polyangiales bacterium]